MSRSKKPAAGIPAARRAIESIVMALMGASVASGPALANEDCSKEVAAAFEKQRLSPGYQVVIKQPGPEGDITITRLLQQPDRMHNKVEAPGQPAPLETIAIGRWAWANQGGGWQELWPQFAQSVTSDVATALGQPVAIADAFTCAGKVGFEGKEFVAYRTAARLAEPAKPPGPENPLLARTVLVDPASGLPVYNLVGQPPEGAQPPPAAVMRTVYSYPADLKIEAPDAVPAGRPR